MSEPRRDRALFERLRAWKPYRPGEPHRSTANLADGARAAVERAGGDEDDLSDLLWSWGRMRRATGPLVDAMRREGRELAANGREEA
jgi:hypothetical protein